MQQKTVKKLFLSWIIASELVSLICPYEEQFTFHRQPIVNMIKVLWCGFQQCLGMFTMLLVEGSSETGLFRYFSNHVFGVHNFGTTKAVRVIYYFKMFKIYAGFQKCSKKIRKKFFVSEIYPSEWVSLNCLY